MTKFNKILLLFILLNTTFLLIFFQKRNQAEERACLKIARVISLVHSKYRFGQPLCRNETLTVDQPLTVVCLNNAKPIEIMTAKDLNRCPTSNSASEYPPAPLHIVRSPDDSSPSFISPMGRVIRNTRLEVAWTAVPNATEYRVILDDGRSQINQSTTQKLHVSLNLRSATSYQLSVQSLNAGQMLGQVTSVITVLSQQQNRGITELFTALDALNLPLDQECLIKQAVFVKQALMEDAISSTTRCFKLMPSTQIARNLGDLYFSIGLNQRALATYQQYLVIATQRKDPNEILIAQARIQYLSQLQQPASLP